MPIQPVTNPPMSLADFVMFLDITIDGDEALAFEGLPTKYETPPELSDQVRDKIDSSMEPIRSKLSELYKSARARGSDPVVPETLVVLRDMLGSNSADAEYLSKTAKYPNLRMPPGDLALSQLPLRKQFEIKWLLDKAEDLLYLGELVESEAMIRESNSISPTRRALHLDTLIGIRRKFDLGDLRAAENDGD